MSGKNKNYNSIIFLTTLSVYLGLVLVGGSPQVLAYAATTRNFDIQQEIEFKEDLDNKPDNEEFENLTKDDFPALLAQFLNEIKGDAGQSGINFSHSENNSGLTSKISGQRFNVVQSIFSRKDRSNTFRSNDLEKGDKRVYSRLEAHKKDLELKPNFSKVNAIEFADLLDKVYSINAVAAKSATIKQVYEGTIATAQNQYVTVVSRLPRAGIDSLIR